MCTSKPSAPPPPPPPAPPPPVMAPTRIEAPLNSGANTQVQRKARGTSALRIDRAGLNTGSAGSGLNIAV